MIIDDILATIEKSDFRKELIMFCDKMKEQLTEKNRRLDEPEILYYYCYNTNQFFNKFLVLVMDIFDENIYYIDIYEFNKTSEEYVKSNSHRIESTSAKDVLIKYAKILKNLT